MNRENYDSNQYMPQSGYSNYIQRPYNYHDNSNPQSYYPFNPHDIEVTGNNQSNFGFNPYYSAPSQPIPTCINPQAQYGRFQPSLFYLPPNSYFMGEDSNIYENPPIFQNEYNNLEDKNEKKDEKEPNRLIDRVYFEKEKY